MELRKQAHGRHQHFIGSRARLNCEEMPAITAWLVRSNLDDPRKIPYLLVWKREGDGKIMEAVRLSNFAPCGKEYVELKRPDESVTTLRIIWRMLPRNGGRALLLLLPLLQHTAPFHLWVGMGNSFSGWSNRVRQVPWCCRSCNRLRYSSEGRSSAAKRARGNRRESFALILEICPAHFPWTEKTKPKKMQMALEWLVVQKRLLAYGYTVEQVRQIYELTQTMPDQTTPLDLSSPLLEFVPEPGAAMKQLAARVSLPLQFGKHSGCRSVG